jgi:hypothetical protein
VDGPGEACVKCGGKWSMQGVLTPPRGGASPKTRKAEGSDVLRTQFYTR